jgi:ABC-type molybdate transport system permease subunit
MVTSQSAILIVLIAVIVAYVVARTRRRIGLLVTTKTWIFVMACVVIGLLALWASQTH